MEVPVKMAVATQAGSREVGSATAKVGKAALVKKPASAQPKVKRASASLKQCTDESQRSEASSALSSLSKEDLKSSEASVNPPPAKRFCSSSSNVAGEASEKLNCPLGAAEKSASMAAPEKSEITFASTATANGTDYLDTAFAESSDPCSLVAWPDSGLEFNIDHLDASEIDNLVAEGVLLPEELDEPSVRGAAPKVKDEEATKEEDQDSQSEAAAGAQARGEASESSGPAGTETTSSSGKGKALPGRRKVKVDWTPELHRRFVQAVEQLGVEKAIPSRILELMDVKCLTRHNIASHLQKYRSHRRHLAAREAEAANWQQQRKPADPQLWPVTKGAPYAWPFAPPMGMPGAPSPAAFGGAPPPIPGRPVMGMPPPGAHPLGTGPSASHVTLTHPQPPSMAPTPGVPAVGMPMHVWGHPSVDHLQAHMWQRPGAVYPMPPPAWYGPDGSMWQYPGFQAGPPLDMWGNPTGMPSAGMVQGMPCFPPQMHSGMGQFPGGMVCGAPAGMMLPGGHTIPGVPAPGMPTPGAPFGAASAAAAAATAGAAAAAAATRGSASTAAAGSPTINSAVSVAELRALSGAGEDVSSADALHLDSFLDEAMPEPMFPITEDLSLGFASISNSITDDLTDFQATGILDAAISEALANPSTPLPLGLKPPSVDGVLEELNRQGITMSAAGMPEGDASLTFSSGDGDDLLLLPLDP